MNEYNVNIKGKSQVYEGVQQLILTHKNGFVSNTHENGYKFQIGSLLTFLLTFIPHIIEGSLFFKDNTDNTDIKISFTRNKLWSLIIFQSIVFILFGVFLSNFHGTLTAIILALILTVMGDYLDYYYVTDLEKNFVKAIQEEQFSKRATGPKAVYTIGTIIGFIILALMIFVK